MERPSRPPGPHDSANSQWSYHTVTNSVLGSSISSQMILVMGVTEARSFQLSPVQTAEPQAL